MKKKILLKRGHMHDMWFIIIRTTYLSKNQNRLKEYREQIINIFYSKNNAEKKLINIKKEKNK